jgi:hypothetical protein
LADATCFSAYNDYDELRYAFFSIPVYLVGCLIGAGILALLIYCGRKCKTTHLLLIPFSLFAMFSGIVYFYLQHIDVLFQFLIFFAWICFENNKQSKEEQPNLWPPKLKKLLCAATTLCLAISLYWTVGACYHEVLYQYGFSSQLAGYLNQHGLVDYGVMVRWMQLTDENDVVSYINTNQTVNGFALNAYYSTNVVTNMNGGAPNMTYVTHKIPTEEENEANLEAWRVNGIPPITFDRCQLKTLFPEYRDIYTQYYVQVLELPEYHLWKAGYQYSNHKLFVRKDIARKHFLNPAGE